VKDVVNGILANEADPLQSGETSLKNASESTQREKQGKFVPISKPLKNDYVWVAPSIHNRIADPTCPKLANNNRSDTAELTPNKAN
jgi:hypothetical protein